MREKQQLNKSLTPLAVDCSGSKLENTIGSYSSSPSTFNCVNRLNTALRPCMDLGFEEEFIVAKGNVPNLIIFYKIN